MVASSTEATATAARLIVPVATLLAKTKAGAVARRMYTVWRSLPRSFNRIQLGESRSSNTNVCARNDMSVLRPECLGVLVRDRECVSAWRRALKLV